jgi:hypothetical protein
MIKYLKRLDRRMLLKSDFMSLELIQKTLGNVLKLCVLNAKRLPLAKTSRQMAELNVMIVKLNAN